MGYRLVNDKASTYTAKPKGRYMQAHNGIRKQKPSAGWVEHTT